MNVKKNVSKKIKSLYDLNKLDREEEFTLVEKWKNTQDRGALKRLVFSQMGFIRKIANGYRGYGLPIEDMISEGYVGIMQAVNSFRPTMGFRFSTYAWHCIRTAVQNFILKSKSIISIKPNNDNKKVFFGGITKTKKLLNIEELDKMSNADLKNVSDKLNVKDETVKVVFDRFSKTDFSLNVKVGEGSDAEFQDWVSSDVESEEQLILDHDIKVIKRLLSRAFAILTEKEAEAIKLRRMTNDQNTLRAVAKKMGISAERVRQLEESAINKLRKALAIDVGFERLKKDASRVLHKIKIL